MQNRPSFITCRSLIVPMTSATNWQIGKFIGSYGYTAKGYQCYDGHRDTSLTNNKTLRLYTMTFRPNLGTSLLPGGGL